MRTKQAIFLLAVNVAVCVLALIFFESYQTGLIHLIQDAAYGAGSGAGSYSIWQISIYIRDTDIARTTVTMYPVIFFFALAGANILLTSFFLLWNKREK